MATHHGRARHVRRRAYRDPSRAALQRRQPRARRQLAADRIAAARDARPHPHQGRGEPFLRRGGHPHAHGSRCDRSRRRALGRDGPRRRGRDPRHPSGSAAGADRSARAGDETDAPRRFGDRATVRRPHPRAPLGDEDRMKTGAELGTLEASGLIQLAVLEPELEYLFRHALVQDAAYSSLLKQDRRTLHRMAADNLLALYPERQRELAAVIALHLERAGDAAAAAEHLDVVGEPALERFAQREALARAYMAAGKVFVGNIKEGASEMEAAINVLEGHTDPFSAAILGSLLTIANARLGDFDAAERTLARAQRLATNGDPIASVDADIARSSVLVERGDVEAGGALATKCALQSEELGAVACSVSANVIAGAAFLARDGARGAEPPLQRGEELAHVASMAAFQTLAEGMLGSVQARLGGDAAGVAGWKLALDR